jgi:hypothetical protein
VKSPKSAAPPLPANYLELTPVGDDAVQNKTGKTWPEWVATLDAIGAAAMPHRDIATRVYEMGVPGWWAQNVTVGYERIRGLLAQSQSRGREVHRAQEQDLRRAGRALVRRLRIGAAAQALASTCPASRSAR